MKAPGEIHAELLVGCKVRDSSGRTIGRLEEVMVDDREGAHFVTEFHVGQYAMLERLMGGAVGRSVLRLLGGGLRKGLAVPWDAMDLRNPRAPRITIPARELREIGERASAPTAMS